MKKALVLYDSVYGNTKRVAMALSRGFEAGGIYVDCKSIQNVDTKEVKNYDIIGIGGPTHFHGASKEIKLFLNRIKLFKMDGKYGFAFETKGDFRLTGSAAKRILRYLKKMNLKIIHSPITGIVVNKEGPLLEKSLELMEQVGLNISDKVNNYKFKKEINQNSINSIHSSFNLYLNRLKWILLGGGPIFFFIRAIYLASTGGDCFGTINPIFSWLLLLSEICLSGIVGITGISALILWKLEINQIGGPKKHNLQKIILRGGITTYIIHFVRVTIWISLCVI
jgi:flavodoxin